MPPRAIFTRRPRSSPSKTTSPYSAPNSSLIAPPTHPSLLPDRHFPLQPTTNETNPPVPLPPIGLPPTHGWEDRSHFTKNIPSRPSYFRGASRHQPACPKPRPPISPLPLSRRRNFPFLVPTTDHSALSQLHSGHCRFLNSYRARIGTAEDPSCPSCGRPVHTTSHLFVFPSHPTALRGRKL